MKAKHVIHTVGPMYAYHSPREAEALLQSALVSTLEMARYLDCESVSIPAISSGIFGFPKDKCADIMIVNSINWASRLPDGLTGTVKEIRLCNFDEPTVSIFK